ncbi:hypothetical protein GKZ68_10355 [Hymenobacter sp. BRD128]|uniref:hypothetical protein n=1 Tax=Hymenobacter sp. BRD128 TaxID=2675878 RepID=UPI0015645544|nr:hypothetical protein [Hymenobacter sp. BRD128]QKG56991.1 hypothetical protein GKZ68_10355 [Hymenobacter sp. BRD128]
MESKLIAEFVADANNKLLQAAEKRVCQALWLLNQASSVEAAKSLFPRITAASYPLGYCAYFLDYDTKQELLVCVAHPLESEIPPITGAESLNFRIHQAYSWGEEATVLLREVLSRANPND